MRKKNKLLALGIVVFFFIATISCGGGGTSSGGSTDSGDTTIGTVNACETTGINQVFTSNIELSSSSIKKVTGKASASDTIESSVLSFIGTTGINEPVIFTTTTGKNVILTISKLKAIKKGFIAISFNAIIEVEIETNGIIEIQREETTKQAIIDLETGKFYDFSGYNMDYTIIDGDILYTIKNHTIYKISLSDITTATPLNNSTYNPYDSFEFKTNNSKIMTIYNGFPYIIDANGNYPPKKISDAVAPVGNNLGTYYYWNLSGLYRVIDENGDIWGYDFGWRVNWSITTKNILAIFKLTVDDNGQSFVSEYREEVLPFSAISTDDGLGAFSVNDKKLHILKNGFCYIKLKSGGGIEIEASPFSLPSISLPTDISGSYDLCATVKNDYLYWIEQTSIKRTKLETGNSVETLYNNSNIVNPVTVTDNYGSLKYISMSVVDNNIIFYQYTSATNVGTYNLQIGSLIPVLISENKAEIMNILELTF
jgi:hypothetical protein